MVAGRGAETSVRGTKSQPPLLLLLLLDDDDEEELPGLEDDSQLEDELDELDELDEESSSFGGMVVYKPPTARFIMRKCS